MINTMLHTTTGQTSRELEIAFPKSAVFDGSTTALLEYFRLMKAIFQDELVADIAQVEDFIARILSHQRTFMGEGEESDHELLLRLFRNATSAPAYPPIKPNPNHAVTCTYEDWCSHFVLHNRKLDQRIYVGCSKNKHSRRAYIFVSQFGCPPTMLADSLMRYLHANGRSISDAPRSMEFRLNSAPCTPKTALQVLLGDIELQT